MKIALNAYLGLAVGNFKMSAKKQMIPVIFGQPTFLSRSLLKLSTNDSFFHFVEENVVDICVSEIMSEPCVYSNTSCYGVLTIYIFLFSFISTLSRLVAVYVTKRVRQSYQHSPFLCFGRIRLG